MMGLSDIVRLSNEQARRAARAKRRPYVPFNRAEIENYPPFPFPNIGSYSAPGWRLTDESFFVDKYGFDRYGPALSPAALKSELLRAHDENPERGFAIIEEGEFQLVIGVFEPAKRGRK